MNEIYLLVGGEATRLQPLSSEIPKALLTVKGERIIDKIINQFSNLEKFNFNLICSIKHKKLWNDYKTNHNNNVDLHFEKVKLESLRIYLSGTNLLTFSKFKIWDVEMGGNGLGYPIQRGVNFGINMNF